MTTYMVTYFISDTCGCGHDHGDDHHHHHHHEDNSEDKIIGKIKSVGAWAHFMPEAFLVKSELSAEEIFNEIQAVASSGDIIFVTKIEASSAACKNSAVIDWIAK